VLRRPDARRPFQLHTDWSMLGIGAVLTQKDNDGKEYVIAYASRSNNDAEAKYSSYEGECLAVVWAVTHFRPYLYGQSFTLVTDHQPLKWLMESDKLTGKLARWALLLQEYDFEVVHKAGLQNLDADGLSRNPSPLQEDLTGARWHGTSDQEVVSGWHASSYLAWMEGKSSQVVGEHEEDVVDGNSEQRGSKITTDVWRDQGILYRLQHGKFLPNTTPQERDRIAHMVGRFHWEGGLMFRRWLDGSRRVVPRPDQRLQLIRQVHEDLGHFGVRQLHSMLRGQYWWMGMQQEVAAYVGRCEVCDRVRSSFNTLSPQLQPLPIMGLALDGILICWAIDDDKTRCQVCTYHSRAFLQVD